MTLHMAFCTDTWIAGLMAEVTPCCGLAVGTTNSGHSAKVYLRSRGKSHSTSFDVLVCEGTGCSCGGQTDTLCGMTLGATNVHDQADLSWQHSAESRETVFVRCYADHVRQLWGTNLHRCGLSLGAALGAIRQVAVVSVPRDVLIKDVTRCALQEQWWKPKGSNSCPSRLASKASASTCSCEGL